MPAMFNLVGGGVGVMADPGDNPDSHDVPHHESGTQASFEVLNVGDAGGMATVSVEVDDVFVTDWESSFLLPKESEPGLVSVGRLTEGDHSILVFVNPGSGREDHDTNTFNVS